MCKGSSGPKGPSKQDRKKAEKREKEYQKKLREQQKKQEQRLKELQNKYNKQNKKLQNKLDKFMGKQKEAMQPPKGDLFDGASSYAQLLASLTQSMISPPEAYMPGREALPRQDMPTGQHVEAPSAPAFIPPDSPGSSQTFSPEAPPAPPTAVQGDQVVIGPAGGQYTDIHNATHGTSALQIPLDKSIGMSGLNIPS